jgi:hypothetical protein
MFTPEYYIDAIQNGKKQFVKAVVTNEVAAKAMNDFVDAQSAYTKEAVRAFAKAGTTLFSESVSVAQKAVNKDYADAFVKFFKKS